MHDHSPGDARSLGEYMKLRSALIVLLTMSLMAAYTVTAQEAAAGKQALQQRVAELKQSMAANKAKLKNYTWTETTLVSIKGDTKKDSQQQCRYGPDGKIQKTPLGVQAPPKEPPGGLKGRIVAKKMAEMKSYTERLKSLISHYAPPDPQRFQSEMQAGKASMTLSPGTAVLVFTDYYKPGDKVTLSFDTAGKKVSSYNVDTYLDDPKKDVVTLTNQFASLPDGTNHLQETVLDAQGKQIQVKTTNSDYESLHP